MQCHQSNIQDGSPPKPTCFLQAHCLTIEKTPLLALFVLADLVYLRHARLPTVAAQAVKGEACSEYGASHRTGCAHTFIVQIFARVEQKSPASSRTGEGGAPAGASSGAAVLPRTPRVLLAENKPLFASRLQDSLTYVSRIKFPPTRPSDLRPVLGAPGGRFTVSQTRCTCGGELSSEADWDAKLVTEVSCECGFCCSVFSEVV